jgi:hypothetical protein
LVLWSVSNTYLYLFLYIMYIVAVCIQNFTFHFHQVTCTFTLTQITIHCQLNTWLMNSSVIEPFLSLKVLEYVKSWLHIMRTFQMVPVARFQWYLQNVTKSKHLIKQWISLFLHDFRDIRNLPGTFFFSRCPEY